MKTMMLTGVLVGMVALAGASDPELPRIEAKNIQGLRKLLGQKAVVYGEVSKTRDWEGNRGEGSGINFVNFAGGKFVVVCFERNYGNFAKKPAEELDGKYVEIEGVVKEYKGTLQIELVRPEQLKKVREPDPPLPEPEPRKESEPTGVTPETAEVEVKKEQPKAKETAKAGGGGRSADGGRLVDPGKYFDN